jgi:hypothetical protein
LHGLDADALLKDRAVLGQLLETFVFWGLRRQASWRDDVRFHHFRDKDGYEVDVVLERGAGQIAGVEVKASATVTAADFRSLRRLRDGSGRRFAAGVVLYDGETSVGRNVSKGFRRGSVGDPDPEAVGGDVRSSHAGRFSLSISIKTCRASRERVRALTGVAGKDVRGGIGQR